jgi:hypothetical protein
MLRIIIHLIPLQIETNKLEKNQALNKYNDEYSPKVRIKVSLENLSKENNLINIPLFLMEYIDKFI